MTPDKRMKGSQALVAALEHEGCEVIFGYPGGVAIPFYDALYDAKKLRHVLVRHEQGAAHAAGIAEDDLAALVLEGGDEGLRPFHSLVWCHWSTAPFSAPETSLT